MERIEAEHQEELIRYIEKFKTIKAEEASKEAAIIISQALPKVAADTVSEFTSKMIDLPSEEFKGKIRLFQSEFHLLTVKRDLLLQKLLNF